MASKMYVGVNEDADVLDIVNGKMNASDLLGATAQQAYTPPEPPFDVTVSVRSSSSIDSDKPTGDEYILLSALPIHPVNSTGYQPGAELRQAVLDMLEHVGGKKADVIYIPTAYHFDEGGRKRDPGISGEELKGYDLRIPERRAESLKNVDLLQSTYNLEKKPIYVDLSDSNFKPEDYEKQLRKANVIYIGGGNTYALNYYMRRLGAMRVIKRRVRMGRLMFIGNSAAAMLAGDTIKPALWKQMDSQEVWCSEEMRKHDSINLGSIWQRNPWNIDWDYRAMGLVPGLSVMPHYRPQWETVTKWLGDEHTEPIANGHAIVYKPTLKGGLGAAGPPERVSPAGCQWLVPCVR